jgi:hypothetical protein
LRNNTVGRRKAWTKREDAFSVPIVVALGLNFRFSPCMVLGSRRWLAVLWTKEYLFTMESSSRSAVIHSTEPRALISTSSLIKLALRSEGRARHVNKAGQRSNQMKEGYAGKTSPMTMENIAFIIRFKNSIEMSEIGAESSGV